VPGWGEVDRTAEPRAYIDYLRNVSALDSVQGFKRKSLQLISIRAGDSVLDVGCGVGDEVIALARMVGEAGRAVGLDSSETMVSEGRRRAAEAAVDAEFRVGDAQALPFEDDSFDAARIERTLQHLPDPDRALRELRRVCRSGGRVVALDPDWGALIIDSDDQETTRLLIRVHAAHVAHGQMGRELWRRLGDAGFEDLVVEPVSAHSTSFGVADAVVGPRETANEAVRDGAIDRAAADRWLGALRAAAARGRFFAALTGFIVAGRTP
jgi:SAM-dependent methyltransferase